MLERILSITLPVFVIAAIGLLYGRLTKPNMAGANKITMDLALPCLIFTSLSAKQFEFTSTSLFLAGATLIVLLPGFLSLPMTRLMGIGHKALLPSVMFANVGPVGIPLTVLAFGAEGMGPAVLLLVFSNLLHFSIGVGLMSGRLDAKLLYANPLVWSTVAGVVFSYFRLQLPPWVDTSLSMIGSILVPLMLLSLGTRLADSRVEHARVGVLGALWAAVIRLLVAWVMLQFLPLDALQKGALILFAGLPPAVFNYMIADRYHCEPDKVASIVIVGHILSLAVLPVAIWLALL